MQLFSILLWPYTQKQQHYEIQTPPPRFMETAGSVRCLQAATNCPYHEPHVPSPHSSHLLMWTRPQLQQPQ
jgi:hypothetical protein